MRKISLLTVFYTSLYSPKEIAKYRFLTMGKTMQYVFMLALLLSLRGLYDAVFQNETLADGIGETAADVGSKGVFTILMIVMIYIFIAGLTFLSITILAAIGEPLARRLGRKLPYRQSWRLTACSITLPVLLFSLLHFLNLGKTYFFFFALAIAIVMIIASIRAIPKPRQKH